MLGGWEVGLEWAGGGAVIVVPTWTLPSRATLTAGGVVDVHNCEVGEATGTDPEHTVGWQH